MAHQQQTAFENIVGKGEIARNEQFLLFPQCFPLSQIAVSLFGHIFDKIALFAAEFEEPKIGISGKGLKVVIKSLPNRKNLDWSKLKAFADDKMNLNKNQNLPWER